jgi:HlyD family secretion protein
MKRWIPVALFAVLLAGLIGWRLSQKRAEAADQAKQREARTKAPVGVETAAAVRRDIVKTFEAVGSVEAPQAVALTPRVSGRILSLSVREGDQVQAGQVLVRIDPAEIEAEVRRMQAAVAQAQARLAEAQLTQGSTNVGVQTTIRQQQSLLRTAEAQRRKAQADYAARIGTAQAAVADAQGRISSAEATISQADAAIVTAQANLANASTRLERQQALFAEGATAKQNVDDAQTVVDVQRAAVNEARQRRAAAVAARDSARAQKESTQRQVVVARNQANADVSAAGSAVTQARAGLEAAQSNRAQAPAYQQNLQALAAAVRAAEADLRASEARRNDTILRSPLTGVVTERNLDVGGLAAPSQSVVTVEAVRQLWVTVAVPEEVSRRVYQGQTADVRFDALPNAAFTGRVSQVYPAADPQSRQFTVRVRLDNSQNRVKPGMFGRVSFVTEQARGVVVIPSEAVKKDPKSGQATVTVVGEDAVADVRPVETGLSDNKGIAVTSGLEPGEKVVTLATRPPKDGQTVRVGGGRRGGDKALTPGPSPRLGRGVPDAAGAPAVAPSPSSSPLPNLGEGPGVRASARQGG